MSDLPDRAIDLSGNGRLPLAKPEPRRRVKARKARAETVIKHDVRQQVAARDGYCRFFITACTRTSVGDCDGPSEWAHMHSHRRSRTRGMAAAARHAVEWSLMLCRRHHAMYDAHMFDLQPIGRLPGADGCLRVVMDGVAVYEEAEL